MNASHDWLLLSLLSAVSLASADALAKWRLSDYSAEDLVLVRFGIPAVLLAPIFVFQPMPDLRPEFWVWVVCAIPLEIIAMLLYMRAIKDSPFYLTLPYLAFTPIFSALAGYVLLGEKIAPGGLAGIFMITAGAFLLNVRHLGRGILEPFRAMLKEKGSRLMLLVAVIYGLTSVLGKGALKYCPPLAFGAIYSILVGIASWLVFAARKPSNFLKSAFRKPSPALASGALMSLMVIFHFLALDSSKVAYMVAVKRTSLLFGIAYGAILFREKGFLLHLFAGTIMVAGVAWISAMV